MRKLSDYQGEEAIELWADLLEPFTAILADKDVASVIKSKKPPLLIAKEILKLHKEEAVKVLERIDPTPVNGFNVLVRLIAILNECLEDDTVASFFGSAEPAKMQNASTGSATESIEDGVK